MMFQSKSRLTGKINGHIELCHKSENCISRCPLSSIHVQIAWNRNRKAMSVSFSFRLIIFLVLFVDHVIIGIAYNVYGYPAR